MSPRKRQRTINPSAQKPPTIKEVAEQAGVSTATVSRVLSGQQVVSDELIQRVHDAVAALEYRPNRTARSLRKRATQIVGVVVSDIQDPFFNSLIRGVESVLEQADYTLLLCNCDEDARREMVHLSTLRSEGVAGILLASAENDTDTLRQFARISPPMVTIARTVDRALVDTVKANTADGMTAAVQLLLEKGHRNIAFMGGPDQVSPCAERKQGFRAALERAGITFNEHYMLSSQMRVESGRDAMNDLLAMDPAPTAVIAGNQLLALGALQVLHERGVKIPEQMALIGVDDPIWASSLMPPMTVIAEPAQEMGEAAARMLLERINNPRQPSRQVVMGTNLVVRESA